MAFDFSYVGYLALSLLLACLGAVDELAFTSIYPELIPEGRRAKRLRRVLHALSGFEGRYDSRWPPCFWIPSASHGF